MIVVLTTFGSQAVYTKYFAANDERLAKSDLRSTNEKKKQRSIFFVGGFLGTISAPLSLTLTYLLYRDSSHLTSHQFLRLGHALSR